MLNNENLYLFKFAWKSIRRNAGRSFFIGFSVSLAVVIAVWVVAFFDGMNRQIEQAVVNTNMGFFQIQEPKYSLSTDSSSPWVFDSNIESKIKSIKNQTSSPELVLDGNISTPEGAAGLLVLGIEPDYHKSFLPISENIISGEFITNGDSESVIIGQELAQLFKFNIGDQMVLNYQDVSGELRSELLKIKGIYHYNSRGFEKRFVYIDQSAWQKLFLNNDTGKILFNRIALKTNGLKSENEINQIFEHSGLKVKTWKNMNPEMAVVLEFHDGMIKFFFLIIGITIILTIMTPVRMLWQERLKEIRMMNIIGVPATKFWKIGLFEVFQMIGISSLFSGILLITIVGIQSKTGIDFRNLNDGIQIERAGIKLPGIIYPYITEMQLLITFIFVFLILSISYIWSIKRTLAKLETEA
jgi:ABC-type lipoprotein release transport system permease subunit